MPVVGASVKTGIDPFVGQPIYGAGSMVLAAIFPMLWTFALRDSTKFGGLGWKIIAYGQLLSHGAVSVFWILCMIFSIRQIAAYFMIAVYFSVPFLWATNIYGFAYNMSTGIIWTDYETIMGALALGIWITLTFVWQIVMVPPVTAWYKMALKSINNNDYTSKYLNDTQTPNLDDLSYLEKPLREAWMRE